MKKISGVRRASPSKRALRIPFLHDQVGVCRGVSFPSCGGGGGPNSGGDGSRAFVWARPLTRTEER